MILSGTAIINACASGELLKIDPLNYTHLNPNSYDITLGNTVHFYNLMHDKHEDTVYGQVSPDVTPEKFGHLTALNYDAEGVEVVYKRPIVDTAALPELIGITMPESGFLLFPGNIYLIDTVEELTLNGVVSEFAGKAELASIGVEVNATARYGNIGDTFRYCAQIKVTYPTMIYPGMIIGQVLFHTVEGAVGAKYTGRYSKRENGVRENGYRPEPGLRDRVRQIKDEIEKKQKEEEMMNQVYEEAQDGTNPVNEEAVETVEEVVAPPVNTDVPVTEPVEEVVMDINDVIGNTGAKVMVNKDQVK